MKKLPAIYKNNINKKIINNVEKCIVKEKNEKEENILETINDLFNGIGYTYNINVRIKTKDKEYDTFLVSKFNNNLLTIENEIIPIEEIISIKRKKTEN